MTQKDSGRPPAEAFHTVADAEQAGILSNPKAFEFFRPFVARAWCVRDVAAYLGVRLDTMLYRVKTFVRVGLLEVTHYEKRAGRPIKHYRSVHDAYFVPFSATPFANTEERLKAHFDERAAIIVPRVAQAIRQLGREGRRIYRNTVNGEVWSESAEESVASYNLYDAASYRRQMAAHRGPVVEFMDDTLELTDAEARELLVELYGVWRRFAQKEKRDSSKPIFFSSSSPRRYRDALGTLSPTSRHQIVHPDFFSRRRRVKRQFADLGEPVPCVKPHRPGVLRPHVEENRSAVAQSWMPQRRPQQPRPDAAVLVRRPDVEPLEVAVAGPEFDRFGQPNRVEFSGTELHEADEFPARLGDEKGVLVQHFLKALE